MFKLTWKEPHSWWEAQWQWKQGLWRGQIISRWRWGYLSGVCFSGRPRGCGMSGQFLKLKTASQKRNIRDEKEWKLGHYYVFDVRLIKVMTVNKRILPAKLISFYKLFLRSCCCLLWPQTGRPPPPCGHWGSWSPMFLIVSTLVWQTFAKITSLLSDTHPADTRHETLSYQQLLRFCRPLIGQSGQVLASHWSVFRARVSSVIRQTEIRSEMEIKTSSYCRTI